MQLKDLLKDIYPGQIPRQFGECEIFSISTDSRNVEPGCLFVALKGPIQDGKDYIPEAIQKGARVIITKEDTFINTNGVCFLISPQPHVLLAKILTKFFHDPSQSVKTIGVTGTNGKTTITYLLQAVFRKANKSCGLIGTIQHQMGNKFCVAKNTTPGLVENYQYLADMSSQKIDYCFMEVSSHALTQGRVNGIRFKSAVFTNLSSDHLDYHRNTEEYFQAKAVLFKDLSPQAIAVINNDDTCAVRLKEMTPAKSVTYGICSPSDIMATNIQMSLTGSTFQLVTPQIKIPIKTHLIGKHNVYNILACAGVCINENIPMSVFQNGIENIKFVPGRLERIEEGQQYYVFVDYAHTEDALRNSLLSLKQQKNARILVAFGCGGDRDKSKRPHMGRVASELADWTFLTSDNPRSEDPESIISQIIAGFTEQKYTVILDRKQAIQEMFHQAHPGDIILIAGKGHEDYQIFKEKTITFSDREIVRDLLKCQHNQRAS